MPRFNLTKREISSIVAAIMLLGTVIYGFILGGFDPEERDRVVAEACEDFGDLEAAGVRFGDTIACTHGEDPPRAFDLAAARAVTPVPPSRLCKRGGSATDFRIHTYLTYEAGRPIPTATDVAKIRSTIGEAEAMLRASSATHIQGYRWLCTDRKPVVTLLEVPAPYQDNNDTFQALPAEGDLGAGIPNQIALMFRVPGACGLGTVMTDERAKHLGNDGTEDGLRGRAYSWIGTGCESGAVVVHEIGHNLGACQPSAPHCTGGGWHGFEDNDEMSYNDGDTYFAGGGQLVLRCRRAPSWWFDCGKDDYWNPARPRRGHFAEHWNTAHSPYLSSPRRRS